VVIPSAPASPLFHHRQRHEGNQQRRQPDQQEQQRGSLHRASSQYLVGKTMTPCEQVAAVRLSEVASEVLAQAWHHATTEALDWFSALAE
jgi:hypothetical protein